uniref:Uncharacterized protein n=1 Tax=Physcomitrium patens TaxID=3218 RepID=A0A2K1L6Z7_PHYPA|nr:hypothetical protein PHYPA_000197 [Physcomitrium patens]
MRHSSCKQSGYGLLISTERLNQFNARIKEFKRTLLETEELNVSILQVLHSQRQTLLHAQNTVCKNCRRHIMGNATLKEEFAPSRHRDGLILRSG